ncbi:adenylate/guanylate cyclase domain-containing protein [Nodosilinea sp. P-1105]|nr:adenylate/guanylate cyclase domain-containing protein [Nodosilinea sp. P-1105]NMF83149.1 adenylate/guanylate cyclase domain-containing protein [Nodosilinea sp. P-1105]
MACSPVTFQLGPYLVLKTDSGSRQLLLFSHTCWTVGRSDDNSLVLPDRWISRNHAMLQGMDNGEFYLIDLGSRNGTFLNGRRVSVPVTLHDGDRITFGQTELQFFSPPLSLHSGAQATQPGNNRDLTATATLHVRRLISVMVVDIRDFTVMTRQIDERILSETIGTWFRRAGEIISQYDSWVDKYIGDAVMAVWIHDPDHDIQADMLDLMRAVSALATMTSQLHQQFPLPFPLRIGAGVNTGYAMVGNAGSGNHPDYTALGDTVNAAFRLETATKELGIDLAMGETTYECLQEVGASEQFFKCRTLVPKGYDSPITAHGGTFSDLTRFLTCHS